MEDFSNEAYYLFFSSLASRTRLAIIDILKGNPKTLQQISDDIQQDPENVLSHLKRLEQCFIIRSEESREGKLYSLNREIVEPLSEILAFHTSKHCPGLKECIPPGKLGAYLKKEAAKTTYIEHE